MEIRNHGVAISGADHTGIFSDPEPSAQVARARVKRLTAAHGVAASALRQAVARNDGRSDLNEMDRQVHRLATELAAAEQELETAEARERMEESGRKHARFNEVAKELRKAREEFRKNYLAAALALGRLYMLGAEASELTNALATRMGTGHVYYSPELKDVLAEASQDPNPIHALKDSGYREVGVFGDWKRQHLLVPLKETK